MSDHRSVTWRAALELRRAQRELSAGLTRLDAAGGHADDRRVLGIWDFRVVPYTIGDLVVLQQRLELLCYEHRLETIDLALVYDPARPEPQRLHFTGGITKENFHYHFPPLLQAAYLNRRVASVLFFGGHDSFEEFLLGSLDRYVVWPTAGQYLAREDAFGSNFDAICDFHREHDGCPWLQPRRATIRWALDFYHQHCEPSPMVVTGLRNNPYYGPDRNAQLDEWLKFFRHCVDRYPVKFVMIGAPWEIDPRFRELPNLLIAKDYGTTVEQDFVLANCGLAYLGLPSGPFGMALFSETPYRVFNWHSDFETVHEGEQFQICSANQVVHWGPETYDQIAGSFDQLYAQLDPAGWLTRLAARAEGLDAEAGRSQQMWHP